LLQSISYFVTEVRCFFLPTVMKGPAEPEKRIKITRPGLFYETGSCFQSAKPVWISTMQRNG
jgi:hypothetical protein